MTLKKTPKQPKNNPVLIWGLERKKNYRKTQEFDKYNGYMLKMFCPSDLANEPLLNLTVVH